MRYKTLSNSNLHISIVGLGTVKLGRNIGVKYPKAFTIPNDNEVISLLNVSAECGINLIDTAPAYGTSEERLGKLLKKIPNDWVISTKVGEIFHPDTGLSSYNFSPEFIRESIHQSCQRLKRDTVDIVLIHSNGNDKEIISKYGALDVLSDLKKEGKIKAIGMSSKTVEGGILTLEKSDIAMVTYNLKDQTEKAVIDYAGDNNKTIFVKKAFASGHIDNNDMSDPIQASFNKIYQNKGVGSVILGSINENHIRENVQKALAAYEHFHCL